MFITYIENGFILHISYSMRSIALGEISYFGNDTIKIQLNHRKKYFALFKKIFLQRLSCKNCVMNFEVHIIS